jgi:tRNA (guanine-N7-)-methyltransferase
VTPDDPVVTVAEPHLRGAFYGRRKAHKLGPRQDVLMRDVLPALSVDLTTLPTTDLRSLFAPAVDRVRLEIGFGGAEHLLHEARSDPSTGYIGAEAFIDGMAKCLSGLDRDPLPNVRLHHGDALVLIDALPDGALDRVDLLYPDPWPKTRHHKRRFVQDATVSRFARILRAGGTFRFASDVPGYVDWTLIRLLRSPDFVWMADVADDWRKPYRGWPGTRYEAKALREGRVPAYLTFQRV